MRRKLAIVGAAIGVCVVALGVVICFGGPPRLDSKARRQWKEKAISEIVKQTTDDRLVREKIATMKRNPSVEHEWDRWISEDFIVMTNGDWIAYRNVCAKEPERIPDLFLGRGSDGKWYYSTYHFCVRMIVLKMFEQPEGLTKFRSDCFLQEFDGQSDECLKKTWPVRR